MRTAAVLAGGLGTRVESLTGGLLPKALLPVGGAPFLHHKLAEMRRLDVERVVLLLGHQAQAIVDYVGDGSAWGVEVDVVLDGPRLCGTGGALKRAASILPEQFWVTYGDTLLDVDLAAAERVAAERDWVGVMTVLHNRDEREPSNVRVEADVVVSYSKRPPPGTHEHIDYGLLYLPRSAVVAPAEEAFDLAVVMAPLIATGRLGAVEAQVPFRTIGTPDEVLATDRWLRELSAGRVPNGNRTADRTDHLSPPC